MRKETRNSRKIISIVVATIAAGIPISTSSASQLSFTDPTFLFTWFLFGMVASFGIYLYFDLKIKDVAGSFTLGYMLAVILRFVADILISNITHSSLSLWLLISMVVGFLAGSTGALIWYVIRTRGRGFKKK